MQKIILLLCSIFLLSAVAGCSGGSPPPLNYYENDIHHGYPGPGVADPSAV
jgi:hypothetical protein